MKAQVLVTKRIYPEAVDLLRQHAEVDYVDSDDGLPAEELARRVRGKQAIVSQLTDRFDAARVAGLADDDWRRRSPEFRPPRLERNLALRDALRPIARRHGTTVSAVAVAWTLAWPGVTGAIVGARSARQVEGWIAAATLELTEEDLDEIAGVLQRTGAGSGPERAERAEKAERTERTEGV